MENLRISPRLEEHERLVSFLDNMAILFGCVQTLNGELPDATRPDVIRLNTQKGLLFVGDAKNSESPNSAFTQHRLLNYLSWLSSFMTGGNNRGAMFAICSNKHEDSRLWVEVIHRLFSIVRLKSIRFGIETFDAETNIIWFEANTFNTCL